MPIKKVKKEYKLKPDWTNIFQKFYDQIEEADVSPEVKEELAKLWQMLLTALQKYGVETLKDIVKKIIEMLKGSYPL